VILVGGYLVFSKGLTANWMPADDKGLPNFMPNGFSGVMMAVSSVFFAYIGFDAVSVLAEESKNPQRDLPRGMILSLVICTIVYILLTLVLTGAVNYRAFDGVGDPLAFIFEKQNLNVGWMQFFVAIAAVVAMTSVLLVFQMGQPRIWMSMSRDGLLPPVFGKIHPKFKTPSFSTIVTGLVVGVPIIFTDKTFVLDFTSIATLFAFVLVCGGVLLIPRKEKVEGKFNIPYINGKIIFPVIVGGMLAFFASQNPSYITNNLDYSFENKLTALNKLLPAVHHPEAQAGDWLGWINEEADAKFIPLKKKVNEAVDKNDQIRVIREFVAANDPVASKTVKISTVIFWLLMFVLGVLSFMKNYSLIPLLGVATCLYLLTGMTLNNWLWFGGWLLLGLVFYFLYGYKNSKLAKGNSAA
jgi:amino acid transporter